MSLREAVENTFKEKEKLIIIGLTGRTGAGCSTVANILSKEKFSDLDLKEVKSYGYECLEERKHYIINDFFEKQDKWVGFQTIDVSSIIMSFVFENGIVDFKKYIDKLTKDDNEEIFINGREDLKEAIDSLKDAFDDLKNYDFSKLNKSDISEVTRYKDFYLSVIKLYRKRFKNILEQYNCYMFNKSKKSSRNFQQYNFYSYLMQKIANNLRASGNPYDEKFYSGYNTVIAERIEKIINIICISNDNRTRICIDAIRNPYEALYLKDTFKSFYLVSVNTTDEDRKIRLTHLNRDELNNLDNVEYVLKFKNAEEGFYHQNILSCTEISDIHISNINTRNGKYYSLTVQLVKYIALMLHPGLVVPSSVERSMQLAYNAKFNSGCLSRQVGAVVTREDYSIQSVGWNDVPKGQTPCNMRDVHNYCSNKDRNMYSQFEIENESFGNVLHEIHNELKENGCNVCMPYCFKDVYNGIKNDKNQVYTRALHAEENAFLQISKYGGTEVKNGCLFTTASPCELCAKKAYQLGIKKIYYIDPYPGISKEHILSFGDEGNPELILFQGAIGDAYVELYRPRIPLKDELEMFSGINVKSIAKGEHKKDNLKFGDIEYRESIVELQFKGDRTDVQTRRYVEIKFLKDNIESLKRSFEWTESTFEGIELNESVSDKGLSLKVLNNDSPFEYLITFDENPRKDDIIKYEAIIKAKDEKKIMEPYLGHTVLFRTEKLVLRVVLPNNLSGIIKNVVFEVYADLDKKLKVDSDEIKCTKDDSETWYEFIVEKPNVNYTYGIKWEFDK